MALKPKHRDITMGQLLFLALMLFFIAASAIRGGLLFLSDFLNLLF